MARTAITTPRTKMGQDIASLGKLIFLYDANKITGVADGGTIASFADSSGNGFTLTQATENLKPTLAVNADGFRNNCARFNGTSQYMSMADNDNLDNLLITGNSGITFFVVGKHNCDTGARGAIIGKWTHNTQYGPYLYYRNVSASDGRLALDWVGASGANEYETYGNTNVNNTLSIGIHSMTSSAPSSSIYVNGVSNTPTVNANSGDRLFQGNTSIWMMGITWNITVPAFYLKGDIYLVGAFKGVLSTTARQSLERLLSARFQIATLDP
jgi:hypothetical protein